MIDWGVARQIARLASRPGELPELGVDLPALARELEGAVGEHTGLQPAAPIPAVEVVARDQWAEANLDTLSDLFDPVVDRLGDRLDAAGPFAGALRAATGVTVAAEVGLVTGFMSRHVLGQYELSLLALQPAPRLLMVAPNLDQAARELGADRESFLRWVTIHELVHAFQFGGVGWLREHLGGMLGEYLETVDVQISSGAAGGIPALADPGELVRRFQEGGLAALVQTPAQRELMERLQLAMAVVEGHAEHVMDALAPALVPEHEGLRAAMDQRRASRSAPQRILLRLLGMDMKMRQYRDGKVFCDAVADAGGPELLARVWESPASLPSADELALPELWIARI